MGLGPFLLSCGVTSSRYGGGEKYHQRTPRPLCAMPQVCELIESELDNGLAIHGNSPAQFTERSRSYLTFHFVPAPCVDFVFRLLRVGRDNTKKKVWILPLAFLFLSREPFLITTTCYFLRNASGVGSFSRIPPSNSNVQALTKGTDDNEPALKSWRQHFIKYSERAVHLASKRGNFTDLR